MLRAPGPAANPVAPIDPRPGQALLAWYGRHARHLPWRARRGERADPYAVWLSEIMLQQTNVTTVKPYFEKFLARWPRVEDLAGAPVQAVMQAWAGLGYYSRARNLHACALVVARDCAGAFPETEAQLLKLPGIGLYTAAAIASIAFDQRAVVVDGNVERVTTRLFGIDEPLPKAKARVRQQVAAMAPATRPGDFAQAMMDLGATLCTPRNPACALCPLMQTCVARAAGTMERYPVKAAKKVRPQRVGAAWFLRRDDGLVLVRTRPPKGLLGGMTEIPGGEWTPLSGVGQQAPVPPFEIPAKLRRDLRWRQLAGCVEHVFTHFSLRLDVYVARAPAQTLAPPGYRWARDIALDDEALPSVMRKIVTLARQNLGARKETG